MPAPGGNVGESFRGLILQLRGRIGLTQREMAARLEVHEHSVQAWESGSSYPTMASLRALIDVVARSDGFTPGQEMVEASALWSAAMRGSARLRTPFDRAWFQALLGTDHHDEPAVLPLVQALPAVVQPHAVVPRRQYWGESPDVAGFLGRAEERRLLSQWVLDDRCRVVGVLGLGGLGKTSLAARLAHDAAPRFDFIYWSSLRDAPSPAEWLAGAIRFLAPNELPPAGEVALSGRLLALLAEARCLLVLDNLESVLQPGGRPGGYVAALDGYGTLLRRLGEVPHQSCLVLTSREVPPELGLLRGEMGPVRALDLGGLTVQDGQELLQEKRLDGDAGAWASLVASCGGNGLALKVLGETILQLFGGSIAEYLAYAASAPGLVVGGLRQLLEEQIERLSDRERHLLRWLAVERDPVSFAELASGFGSGAGRSGTLEAVEGLRRRSLLERGERRSGFLLHSVVLEYVTEQLIEEALHELTTGDLDLLLGQPLVKATARDHIRRSQERIIAASILERLVATTGGSELAEQRILALLDDLRGRPFEQQGYGAGNLVNLLRLLRGDLRRVDLSGLRIRQAFLQGVDAQDASLAGAELIEVVLGEAFTYPTAVTLSADGVYLAGGTSAGEVCLWRVADRRLLSTLRGHTGGVRSVAMSRDNRLIVSGSFDGTVRVWDAANGAPLGVMAGHAGLVYAVALSGDGSLIASGGQDGAVRLWETGNGRLLATLPGNAGGVWGVAVSVDGRRIASGSFDGVVRLWDAASGEVLRVLEGHTGSALGVALSHDGQRIASASLDGTARLWDAETGQVQAILEGHTGGVRDVALSDDGRVVASGGLDGTVRVWDSETARPLSILQGHVGLVYAVSLSGDGHQVASGSFDGTIKLWDAAGGRLLSDLQGYNRGIRSVAVSRDGRLLVSGNFDGVVRLWDTESGQLVRMMHGHTSGVRDVALGGGGRTIASGSFDGTVKLWDTSTGRLLATLPGHVGGVWGVALSGDGSVVASGGYDGTVRLRDAANGRLLDTLAGHGSAIRSVALSGDGGLVASGSEDKTVRLWETSTGRLLGSFEGHTGGIWDVSLSADGRLVASGSDDQTVRVWETASGRPVTTLTGHTNAVWGVALTEDGSAVASASFDGTVRLWDVESDELLSTMAGHDGRVCGVALDAEGHLAASAGVDGTVRIWDARGGTLRFTLHGDRRYERVEIGGLTGITEAQRESLLALGAVE